jgi:hypothetical protein
VVIVMAANSLNPVPTFVRLLTRWWWSRIQRSPPVAELSQLAADELECIAHGVNSAEFRVLAGKWPDSPELLSWRLPTLNLDEHKLREKEPQVLRDMQRVCTLCASKGRCEHDFAYKPSDPTWRAYCLNSQTLAALETERTQRLGPIGGA